MNKEVEISKKQRIDYHTQDVVPIVSQQQLDQHQHEGFLDDHELLFDADMLEAEDETQLPLETTNLSSQSQVNEIN